MNTMIQGLRCTIKAKLLPDYHDVFNFIAGVSLKFYFLPATSPVYALAWVGRPS